MKKNRHMLLLSVIAWIPMLLIAILNGMLREYWFAKKLSELYAHQLSTATVILFLGIYIWSLTRFWRVASSAQALAIGLIWFGLTISFEFLFGHYVMQHPWSRLLQDYNIFAGRVWVLVLMWIAIAPCLFNQWHK